MKTGSRIRLGALVACCFLAPACEDDPECESNADCPDVVCADGVKHKQCTDGTCFQAEDCGPATPGGW